MATSRDREFAFTLIRSTEDGDGRTFRGTAAVFNTPAHIIDDLGEYDEVIQPGAFKRTLSRGKPIFMFNHGKHPLIGQMPLGVITNIYEDASGLNVEARMSDNWLIQPVRDAIKDGAITGMSFRMHDVQDKWQTRGGSRLRTVTEVKCPELGPVVLPAYEETSASIRSSLSALDASLGGAIRVELIGQARDEMDGDNDDPGLNDAIGEAVAQRWGLSGVNSTVYPTEVHKNYALIAVKGNDRGHKGLFRVNYTIGDDGMVTVDEPTPVDVLGQVLHLGDAPPSDPNLNNAALLGQARDAGRPVGLTATIKQRFTSELRDAQTNPSVDIAAGMRRPSEWASSGHLPTGLTYEDCKWMYDQCAAELQRRDPNSTAGGDFPAMGSAGRSRQGSSQERCHALTSALTDAASDSEGNDTRSQDFGTSDELAVGTSDELAIKPRDTSTPEGRARLLASFELSKRGIR